MGNKKVFDFCPESCAEFGFDCGGGGGNCKDSTTFQFNDRPRQTCSVFATTKGKCKRPHGGGNKRSSISAKRAAPNSALIAAVAVATARTRRHFSSTTALGKPAPYLPQLRASANDLMGVGT